MALTGTETLQVLGQSPAGVPAASTFQTTTSAIAALAVAGGSQTSVAALNTVGGTTIPASNFLAKVTARGGVQSAAFTDTTDTAANIIAALGLTTVGQSFKYVYDNNTIYPATISAGAGVTLNGAVPMPANSWSEFLVVLSAAGAITITELETGVFPHSGTFTANGVTPVTITDANITPGSQVNITLKTVGGTVGTTPYVATITAGTGFTTIATASNTSVYNYKIEG